MSTIEYSGDRRTGAGWFQLIRESRRKYAVSRFIELRRHANAAPKRLLRLLYQDVVHMLARSRDIVAEAMLHGAAIRREYGVSLLRQVAQQFYLVFVLRVPQKHYRGYLLCAPARWKLVREFTYENYRVQMRLVDSSFPEERDLLNDKLLFFNFCLENGIETPPVLAAFEDGNAVPLRNKRFTPPPEDVFVKPASGKHGDGAERYVFQEGCYARRGSAPVGPDEFLELMKEKSRGGGVLLVQRVAQNHRSWQPYTSGALATCRILTVRLPDDDATAPIAATFRMPTGSNETDNTACGGIASPIELQSGRLGRAIRKTPYKGKFEFDVHPDTGRRILGSVLPGWKELLEFTAGVHAKFNSIFVGWDIVLTTSGFSVLEGNIGWSARVIESPQMHPLVETKFPALYDAWAQRFSTRTS